jgi:hypothetical protein
MKFLFYFIFPLISVSTIKKQAKAGSSQFPGPGFQPRSLQNLVLRDLLLLLSSFLGFVSPVQGINKAEDRVRLSQLPITHGSPTNTCSQY